MAKPKFKLADIFRSYKHLLGPISRQKEKIISNILRCKTEDMGTAIEKCTHCEYKHDFYKECHDRHCTRCQTGAKRKWLDKKKKEALKATYYHAVFTVPHIFNEIALTNKVIIYNILFKSASETLLEVFREKYKGLAGFDAILHTWGEGMPFHMHIHFCIPAGCLGEDDKWIPFENKFSVAMRAVSKVFRAKFTKQLKRVYKKGKLNFFDFNSQLNNPGYFYDLVDRSFKTNWHTFTKARFDNPSSVYEYIAKYTHKIAFSDYRIKSINDGEISFIYKDYKSGVDENGKYKTRTMTLDAKEFMRRFLQHAVPKGFTRIRSYGFLANSVRKKNLSRLSKILANKVVEEEEKKEKEQKECPSCKRGTLYLVLDFKKPHKANERLDDVKVANSS